MNYNNFVEAKRKLSSFAKRNGVVVSWVFTDECANYHQRKTKKQPARVVIRAKQSRSKKICVFLHELGHVMDYQKRPHCHKFYQTGYSAEFWGGKAVPQYQKKIILLAETRAWDEAARLAKKLGIRVGKRFQFWKRKSLASFENR